MNSEGLWKKIAAVFVGALVVYIFGYSAIEQRRTRHGPWQVAFTNDSSGTPAILINQPKLAITNVLIAFPGETTTPHTNAADPPAFTQPRPVPFDVPFGTCVFMDATSLPGTIVFELFGHEIQLLPRVLTIDKTEQPWQSGARLTLNQAPVLSEPKKP
jgi:hypothetical protein